MSTAKGKIRRVVIVDDSRTSQAILEAAFEARPDFTVVGLAADAEHGVDLIRRLAPDLVTIDLCMPYIDGAAMLELTASMTAVCKIIVSGQPKQNIAVTTKLESLGASLCLGKGEVTGDPAAFFKKVNRACDQTEAAGHEANGLVLTSDHSRRSGLRRAMPPIDFGYPVPVDEAARLSALAAKQLANAARERHFDRITRHVSDTTGFPVCLVTFIDRDTQWIKSSFGYDSASGPRADAFCNYTIAIGDLFVVANAATDPRFAANPMVVGAPGFRTYAGYPIISDAGIRLGALCILDTKVRPVPASVRRQLIAMADILGAVVDYRPAMAA